MSKEPIRCLEFFSGIGGLHYALKIANINAQVVGAFDVNLIANKVYKHNFGISPITKPIDRLTAKDIDAYKAECWLLSPPCQPYTSGGLQKDIEDPRAKPLLHLVDLLPTLCNLPKYLFLENVKNFETSKTRLQLIKQLKELKYHLIENLLTPTQFGIPNNRVRYYLVAYLKEEENDMPLFENTINTTWPPFSQQVEINIPPLSYFLEDFSDRKDESERLLVPDKYILRLYKFRLDIVRPTDKLTSCITKAYGSHHIQTSGSLIQTKDLENVEYNWDDMQSLLSFGLRFLSPTEISRLHAFPGPKYQLDSLVSKEQYSSHDIQPFSPAHCLPHLIFPEDITQMQQYRLLGNSLNCWVVAELYRCLLFRSN
ncbi:S-adenosyl-L-methionine-dependent methyltransferase [Cokeromyces recurvatus]|uniref:S-adenosyl-L-methionine-dependent methyltransferase n=1 Tax=Cokeromyces recurvatus TaxID=90255 RepID=UPI00221E9098|nr:S-adenosyl-L-methionine-dependent methyltransferase [Cokeromyces recurvatus]KAI7906956.1 S-adenosyl-L-methionine-dependent methyltransferase [Cokeromyces recurvatus]